MNTNKKVPRRVSAGFTLMELLVVVGIIGVLVGIVIGISGFANRKAAMSRALSDIERIKTALEDYRIEQGRYFGPVSGAQPVTGLVVGGVRFSVAMSNHLKELRLIDPWGRSYMYSNTVPTIYRIWSLGSNETNASDDVESGVGNY